MVFACLFGRFSIPRGLTAAPDVSCITSFTSTIVSNSYDFQSSLSTNVRAHGSGWGLSFSASAGYQKTVSLITSGKMQVILSTAHCNQYFTKLNILEPPDFSDEMMVWLEKIVPEYTKNKRISDNSIYEFLDYFGTHFSTETLYGARFTYEHRLDTSKSSSSSSKKLSVEAEASLAGAFSFSGGAGFGMSSDQKEAAMSFSERVQTRTISVGAPPPYNGDAMTWASTVKETPVPVTSSLEPIYKLFDKSYMKQSILSTEVADHLLSRLEVGYSKYCRDALKNGLEVECSDNTVLKFPRFKAHERDLYDLNGAENEISCLDACHKTEDCVMIIWTVESGDRCRLYKERRNLVNAMVVFQPVNCSSCTMYVIQTSERSIRLAGLRYNKGQRNQIQLISALGSLSNEEKYASYASLCKYMCSTDSLCMAYAVSTDNQYKHNCETMNRHSAESLVQTKQEPVWEQTDFDIQLLSKRAKVAAAAKIRHTAVQTPCRIKDVKSSDAGTATECAERCKSQDYCTMFSFDRTSSDCWTQTSRGSYELQDCSDSDTTTSLLPQKEQQGWMNITNLRLSNRCETSTQYTVQTENACAHACLTDINCISASFTVTDNGGVCKTLQDENPEEEVPTHCFLFHKGSKLFVANFEAKLTYFKSRAP